MAASGFMGYLAVKDDPLLYQGVVSARRYNSVK